jgi:hypothetical protein
MLKGRCSAERRILAETESFKAVLNRRVRSFPERFAKIDFGSGFRVDELPAGQVGSRTKMRPSSKWIF